MNKTYITILIITTLFFIICFIFIFIPKSNDSVNLSSYTRIKISDIDIEKIDDKHFLEFKIENKFNYPICDIQAILHATSYNYIQFYSSSEMADKIEKKESRNFSCEIDIDYFKKCSISNPSYIDFKVSYTSNCTEDKTIYNFCLICKGTNNLRIKPKSCYKPMS